MVKKEFVDRIASIFKGKKEKQKEEKKLSAPIVHLNFFLLYAAFKMIQKGKPQKTYPLFTTKIVDSKSQHLRALIKQAETVCSKQDIELFCYKECYSQNHFSLHKVVQWKFYKYIKSKEEAVELINKMKKTSPELFKKHLITLLRDENLISKRIEQEAQNLKKKHSLWNQGKSSTTSIPPI